MAYRPPGRSNRSGRTNADNDVFEGLPVKQWGQQYSRVSLAPPVAEAQPGQDDKWGEPPMPRDYQLLNPWTQHLLRLARSGKVGTKRKQESDSLDEEKLEEETAAAEEVTAKSSVDERVYIAKKWKPVPEHALVQEHKHFEFLAKRRKGLPSLYAPDQQNGGVVSMRKTKVQRPDVSSGETVVYEVLVPEGSHVDGEVMESTELADAKPVTAAPGTIIEGVGIANDEGVLVAEHLKPAMAPRRNRPPPKKKGGPGRGKKRVTFTNPDGSTYTTIVPNATKIVPQPGQIVKHVAKGEEAGADVSVEEAAQRQQPSHEGGEGSGSDEGEDEGDDDDDREDGDMSDEDAPGTGAATPAKPDTPAKAPTSVPPVDDGGPQPMEDIKPSEEAVADHQKLNGVAAPEQPVEAQQSMEGVSESAPVEEKAPRDVSSSPEVALAKSKSRSESLAEPPPVLLDEKKQEPPATESESQAPAEDETVVAPLADPAPAPPRDPTPPADAPQPAAHDADRSRDEDAEPSKEKSVEEHAPAPMSAGEPEAPKNGDGEEDLLGNLEKHLGQEKGEEA